MRHFILVSLVVLCANAHGKDCVILLHGLARTSASMEKMEDALTHEGYIVVNHPYPSRDEKVESLASKEVPHALKDCPDTAKVHFVTHSLGGIVLRQYLSDNAIDHLGRTVMLAPPNQGSQVVDKLKKLPGYKLLNGPAGMELGTDVESVPSKLGKADFEVGIIAGTRSINLILSTMLPNPDDGKVSVENTKLEGMTDHISIPVSHPFIMRNDRVIEQVIFFLKTGRFIVTEPPEQ